MCAPWFAVIAVALCCISFVHADSTTVTSAASTELKNNSSTIAPSTATNDLKTTTHADIATTLQQRQCSAHQDCDSGSYCDVGYQCFVCQACIILNDAFDEQCPEKCGSSVAGGLDNPYDPAASSRARRRRVWLGLFVGVAVVAAVFAGVWYYRSEYVLESIACLTLFRLASSCLCVCHVCVCSHFSPAAPQASFAHMHTYQLFVNKAHTRMILLTLRALAFHFLRQKMGSADIELAGVRASDAETHETSTQRRSMVDFVRKNHQSSSTSTKYKLHSSQAREIQRALSMIDRSQDQEWDDMFSNSGHSQSGGTLHHQTSNASQIEIDGDSAEWYDADLDATVDGIDLDDTALVSGTAI
eukprot:m.58186 g.58186  ORF g.58186 m.58186 type:complete len:358 (-) comp11664_c0_seq2:415-1488(-)